MTWYEVHKDTVTETCGMLVPGGVVIRVIVYPGSVALTFIPGATLAYFDHYKCEVVEAAPEQEPQYETF